jgi:tetratricopeptide (TPR) repeat protein
VRRQYLLSEDVEFGGICGKPSDCSEMGIRDFYLLLDKGKIEEAYLEVEKLKGEERGEAELIKALFLLNTVGYEPAAPIIEKIYAKSQDSPRLNSLARLGRAWLRFWEAKYEDAWLEVEEAEKLLTILSQDSLKKTRLIEANLLFLKGSFLSIIDKEDDRALKLYDECVSICKENGFPLKSLVTVVFNNISVIHKRRGDWPQAIDYNQKILDFSEEMGNEVLQIYPLIQLGVIQFIQGDLDLAQDLLHKALRIGEKYQVNRGSAWAMENIALIHQSRGEYEKALKQFETALEIYQTIKLAGAVDMSYIYYRVCQLHLARGAPDLAREYLVKLQEQSKIDMSLDPKIYSQMAEALILKTSQRFKEKAQAQDLLRKVMENKGTTERIRFLAMLHLCDLLFQEVRISGEEALFSEVEDITNYILEQAQIWRFAPDLINAFILQAKFMLISGDADQASEILSEALQIAKDRNLNHLADQVRIQQTTLKNELNRWQEFAEKNAPLRKRLAFAEVEEYLQMAIKIRDLKSNRPT